MQPSRRNVLKGLAGVTIGAPTGNVMANAMRAGGPMSAPIDVARLSALGRLWAKVKLFHPYLATRDIDWDAALVSALPKVRSAETAEQYRAAVDEMLAALGDPETHTSIQTTRPEELDFAVA